MLLDQPASSMTKRARSNSSGPARSQELSVTSASSKEAPSADDVQELKAAVDALAHCVRQLMLVMDEIREDLIHAVRNTGLDPAISRADYQQFLDQVEETIADMEETNSPIGTKKAIEMPVDPPKVKETNRANRSLFE